MTTRLNLLRLIALLVLGAAAIAVFILLGFVRLTVAIVASLAVAYATLLVMLALSDRRMVQIEAERTHWPEEPLPSTAETGLVRQFLVDLQRYATAMRDVAADQTQERVISPGSPTSGVPELERVRNAYSRLRESTETLMEISYRDGSHAHPAALRDLMETMDVLPPRAAFEDTDALRRLDHIAMYFNERYLRPPYIHL